jgi:hypothetical protein
LFQEEEEEDMIITLEDLRGDSPAICGDFNKIKEEVIRAVGRTAANRENFDGIRSIPQWAEIFLHGRTN